MTQSELILEYIDGSLDPSGEQALFDSMARNPETRGMLRQYITISDAVRLDHEAYTPPAAVEGALMRGLGFVPPETVRRTLPFFSQRRFLGLVGAFILGLLLAGGSVYQIMSAMPDGAASAASGAQGRLATSREGANLPMVVTIPVPVAQDGSADRGVRRSTPPPITSHSLAEVPSSRSVRIPAPRRFSSGSGSLRDGSSRNRSALGATLPALNSSSTSDISSNSSREEASLITRTAPIAVVVAPNPLLPIDRDFIVENRVGGDLSPLDAALPEKEREKGGFLELRRGLGGDLSSTHALDANVSPFEDFAAGGYLRSGSSFAVGIEGGYERYAQTLRYEGEDTILIEQRPAYLWGGGSLRYQPGAIGGTTVRPLFQGTVGLASAGPLFRGRIGLGVDVVGGVRASLGFEMSSLLYTFDGAGHLSGRWGLVGGIETNLW